MEKKRTPFMSRSLAEAGQHGQYGRVAALTAGFVEGLKGATLVLAPAKGMVGRRYASRGIAGDWAAIGQDIETAGRGYLISPDAKKHACRM